MKGVLLRLTVFYHEVKPDCFAKELMRCMEFHMSIQALWKQHSTNLNTSNWKQQTRLTFILKTLVISIDLWFLKKKLTEIKWPFVVGVEIQLDSSIPSAHTSRLTVGCTDTDENTYVITDIWISCRNLNENLWKYYLPKIQQNIWISFASHTFAITKRFDIRNAHKAIRKLWLNQVPRGIEK